MSQCRWCLNQDYNHKPDCINAGEIMNSWTDHKTHGNTPRPRVRETEGRYKIEKKPVTANERWDRNKKETRTDGSYRSYDCSSYRHHECSGRVDHDKCGCVCHEKKIADKRGA